MKHSSPSISLPDLAVCLLITAFAFYFNTVCGSRGFFAFDQSIVFDGAYRVYSGEVPYKDFYTPHGSLVFYIQAMFFKLFGVRYYSYILSASCFNALAVLLCIILVRQVFIDSKLLSYIAGALTSVWFFPPFGTLYVDQVGFFFTILGIVLFLAVHADRHRGGTILIFASGLSLGLSFLCKQNIAIAMGIIPPILAFITWHSSKWKALYYIFIYLGGMFWVFFLGLLWVYCYANPLLFSEYFLTIPFGIAVERFGDLFKDLNVFLIIAPTILLLAALLYLWILIRKKRSTEIKVDSLTLTGPTLAIVLCASLVFSSQLFGASMNNNPSLMLVHLGLILPLLAGSMVRILERQHALINGNKTRYTPSTVLVFAFTAAFITALFFGLSRSLNREEQEGVTGASFGSYLPLKNLTHLRWGEPTLLRFFSDAHVSESDFVGLVKYLSKKNKRFFVFPDYTLLYGVLRVRSPQPILWFHKGVTYSKEYNKHLDLALVTSLQKHKISMVVLEKESFLGTKERLKDFPILSTFIKTAYSITETFGNFEVREQNQ